MNRWFKTQDGTLVNLDQVSAITLDVRSGKWEVRAWLPDGDRTNGQYFHRLFSSEKKGEAQGFLRQIEIALGFRYHGE